MTESFWIFPHSSKLDVLRENKHYPIIKRALSDPITQIEPDSGDWILYGNEEALLVQPSSCYLRIVMFVYYQIIELFPN